MTNERISLKEAYDNRDVIAQIAILNDKLDSIPDADLTNVVLKTGDQIIDGKKTFNDQMTVNDQIIANGQIVANGGVLFANNGLTVNGTLQVDGDIIQNGSAYDTHAEQVYTTNDLIVTRDGAVGGIAAGQLSGIRVKKYNGADDLNLGVDNLGVMRVGDLGDEQPLATRDEASAMTSGALVKWDGVNKKMIAPASNVGSDTQPVKIVDGEPVAVSALNPQITILSASNPSISLNNGETHSITPITITKKGMYMCHISGVTNPGQTGYSIGGIDVGGAFRVRLQNLYFQGAGSYYHSMVGFERFNPGDVVSIGWISSMAMSAGMTLSLFFLGDI